MFTACENNVATTAELTTILCWHVLLELEVALFPWAQAIHTQGEVPDKESLRVLSVRGLEARMLTRQHQYC